VHSLFKLKIDLHQHGSLSTMITAVPLTTHRHAGLDPASSKLLKSLDSGSVKNAVWNDGNLDDFHVSQDSEFQQTLCSKGLCQVCTMLAGQQ
jgi:hypothetical protein